MKVSNNVYFLTLQADENFPLIFRSSTCVNSYFCTSTASNLSAKKCQRCSQYSQQFFFPILQNQWRDSSCTRTKTIGWKVRIVIFFIFNINSLSWNISHLVQNLLYLQNRLYQPQGTSTNIFSCLFFFFFLCLFLLHFTPCMKITHETNSFNLQKIPQHNVWKINLWDSFPCSFSLGKIVQTLERWF